MVYFDSSSTFENQAYNRINKAMIKGSQKTLIQGLVKEGVIKNMNVAKIMEMVDRQFYAPHHPYEDSPQVIGYGATISAPHMHAYALEYLYGNLISAKNVLDVGSGTGYLTAAMALIIPSQSKVYGIEHVPQLAKKSLLNIGKSNPELLEGKLIIGEGDGRNGWIKQNIQFDVIHVGAAADKVPEALLDQLAEGGKMLIPVGAQHRSQQFQQITKSNGKIYTKTLLNVRYVPLTDLKKQIM